MTTTAAPPTPGRLRTAALEACRAGDAVTLAVLLRWHPNVTAAAICDVARTASYDIVPPVPSGDVARAELVLAALDGNRHMLLVAAADSPYRVANTLAAALAGTAARR